MTAPSTINFRYSADEWSEPQRRRALQEVYGRAIIRQDLEPLPGRALDMEVNFRVFPGLGLASATCSGLVSHRRAEHVSGDDLVFNICLAGGRSIAACGRETTIQEGEGLLANSADVGVVTIPTAARYLSFRVPFTALASRVGNIGACLYRPVGRDTEALRLLRHYAGILREEQMATANLQAIAAGHVYDLIALALRGTRVAAQDPEGSTRTARLAAIRADALANLAQVRLSPRLIARRHDVSQRYVHLLFAETGQTFGEFVTAARLSRACELLLDPTQPDRKISEIAHSVGYGDLSTFNRAFRRRYGDTPSGVRAKA